MQIVTKQGFVRVRSPMIIHVHHKLLSACRTCFAFTVGLNGETAKSADVRYSNASQLFTSHDQVLKSGRPKHRVRPPVHYISRKVLAESEYYPEDL